MELKISSTGKHIFIKILTYQISRESELENFELLNKFDIAPPVFCRFFNGFVVGYLPGETLTTESVRNPKIVP